VWFSFCPYLYNQGKWKYFVCFLSLISKGFDGCIDPSSSSKGGAFLVSGAFWRFLGTRLLVLFWYNTAQHTEDLTVDKWMDVWFVCLQYVKRMPPCNSEWLKTKGEGEKRSGGKKEKKTAGVSWGCLSTKLY
jgi:hypothetical protein